MKKFELYWKDLNIGSIVETNWDMRSSGDIVYKFDYLAEPSENELMSDFVKFSIQDSILLGEGVEDDDLYLSQAEEEKKFLDLIVDTKTDWYIINEKGEKEIILCPIFHEDNEITWMTDPKYF
ncbi:hypothetical protein HYN56_18990 [Flavobacterium crocinum]|uniref:Uncharacterized protein n=1 Tax=Flavobacterium crocinum TaxID=2183896 RepID=A0A2S1YQY6_9FLAO|nr:hypothetical protein [Flavobacterium crocinum]AWK06198.1 hypothetical protein HYN56_18990 [Flavobacterium crocinum]